MSMNSNAKYAMITGSAKGLGRMLAFELARKGYQIIVHYLYSQQDAEQTAAEIREQTGVDCICLKADVRDPKQVAQMFDIIKTKGIALDIFIQNVGNYLKKDILETSADEWNEIINSNLNATFYCNQHAAELMIENKSGRIINIGFANLGRTGAKKMIAPYYIAKTGVLILTQTLAAELADKGITVNMVSPGVLETSINKPIHEIPVGRLATLEETVRAILFLTDEQSNYITGANLDVAGGWRL